MTDNDKDDILTDNCAVMIDNACCMVMLAKKKQANVTQVIYVDSNGNDTTANVYDFNIYVWKSSDSFDKLASDYLGNVDYGTLIAYFNKIAVESEIEAGTKIKIPVLTETNANTDNQIFAMPEKQENYGIDIALDNSGNFAVKNGDIDVVGGSNNLAQAMALRLTTASQKRIRLASYGIRSTIGDTMAVQSYLQSSIEQTVKEDPRIESVDKLNFWGNKDVLNLSVTYTDINENVGNFKGEL